MITILPNFKIKSGIKHFSDSGYTLPDFPTVINKKLPGCGFTEFCLRSDDNVILCVPRIALLENKMSQDRECNWKIFSVSGENDFSTIISDIQYHHTKVILRQGNGCKFITTFDSFRVLKTALGDAIQNFHIVVDEFQNILKDASFKSMVENEFLDELNGLYKICFVSATPIPLPILQEMPGFENTYYQEFEWPTQQLINKRFFSYSRPKSYINVEIQNYLSSNFPVSHSLGYPVYSKELVLYMNNVEDICKFIKKNGLTLDNTSVLCAKSERNRTLLRKAFGITRKGIEPYGEIPDGENNKMFTFCTSAVYSGVDFYSTCARSIIYSNGNITCMRDDPAIDIAQIVGRQRWERNPWKNFVDIYVSFNRISEEEIKEINETAQRRNDETERLLSKWSGLLTDPDFIRKCESDIILKKYEDDYIGISRNNGSCPKLVFNKMVQLNDLYTNLVLQNVYKDEYTYSSSVSDTSPQALELQYFNSLGQFTIKMKYIFDNPHILDRVDFKYSNYFYQLGPDVVSACQFQKYLLDERLKPKDTKVLDVYSEFEVGERYTRKEIKEKLGEIYRAQGIDITPKATDLSQWFVVEDIKVNGNRGYKIINKN